MVLAAASRLGPAKEQLGKVALANGLLVQDDDDEDSDLDDDEDDGSKDKDEENDDDYPPPGWSD